jgi:hypothetical protein
MAEPGLNATLFTPIAVYRMACGCWMAEPVNSNEDRGQMEYGKRKKAK